MEIYLAYVIEDYGHDQLVGVYTSKLKAYKAARKQQFELIMDDRDLYEGYKSNHVINWRWKVRTTQLK